MLDPSAVPFSLLALRDISVMKATHLGPPGHAPGIHVVSAAELRWG